MTGYEVDTEGMRGAARGFAAARDHIESAATTLGGAKVPHGAFGEYGPGVDMAADLDEIIAVYQRHLTTRHQRVGSLAEGVDAAADTYDRDDASGRSGITTAGRGA